MRYVAICLLVGLMVLGASDVVARYLVNHSIVGTTETSKAILIAMTVFALAQTQRDGVHIKVEILYRTFPELMKKYVDIVFYILCLILFALIAYSSFKIGLTYDAEGRRLQTIYMPASWLQYATTIGSVLLCFEFGFQTIERFLKKELITGKGTAV